MIAGEKVSVVCGCMDRHRMLGEALSSWLAAPEIDEVVVVDWSSSVPVETVTSRFDDGRVQVVRVPGQRRWMASKSHNLGVRMASGDLLLRLDADYLLRATAGFFSRHPMTFGAFYCADWRQARVDNERHLAGALYVHRRHFLAVNGYNERIATYGYEDEDLFERLAGTGLARRNVDLDTLHHIPHSDALRVKHQDVADVEAETRANARAARARPWGPGDHMATWNVRRESSGVLLCEEGPRRAGDDGTQP